MSNGCAKLSFPMLSLIAISHRLAHAQKRIRVRLKQSFRSRTQTRIVADEPEEGVRVEQEPHRMYSAKSSSGSSKSSDMVN